MVWFQVDDKFHTSGKVLSIPRSHRLAAVGLWTMAGAWSAQNLTDGRVPEYVLAELGATPRLRQALTEARLWLDQGSAGIEFGSWGEYQRTRERVEDERAKTAERQRKWRERQDGVTRDMSVSNAVSNGVSNAPVTAPIPNPTQPIQKETSSLSGSANAEPPTPAMTRKRATALPASWQPTEEHYLRAQETNVDIAREVVKFRTHAEDKGRLSKSWNAAFTQWLIKATEYAQPQRQGVRPIRSFGNDQWIANG